MGTRLVWTNAEVIINSTDLSEQVTQVALTEGFSLQNSPSMGDDTDQSVQGLRQFSGTITFNQSFVTGGVDATIRAIMANRGSVLLEITPDSTVAVGAANPKRRCLVVLGNYQPYSGSAGQIATATVDFQAAGNLSTLTS
ncbi:hypothetical protein [Thalassobaculum litoreum]|uniref:Phage tail tube protein n=1 Tax=Thalassobaculum litoreum DSM 18839 TaxID=1123362 RepID=A0A8G2EVE9_9PROT|nr:hypothetical protein [Thalassobaculum litoreum]SDF83681.1 hypothetical protein SAMN05660686_02477 [Thalassobaculum litoreum DSM 18839]